MKVLLTSNEAVARGAYESGAKLASGYPGTPATMVIEETAKQYKEIYCEWSTNEKVALEVAMGASFAGYRSFVVMKTVGLNVAHDALQAAAQAQTNGGLVLVVADDVGRDSDDYNDCRFYGESTGVPILEPSTSQEAKEYMQKAFDISEKYNCPVILRLTSIICKTSSLVEIDENYRYEVITHKPYKLSYYGLVATTMMLGIKNSSNPEVLKYYNDFNKFQKQLAKDSNNLEFNSLELNSKDIGIVTAGASYCYVKEVLPDASVLKLGLIHPLPQELIKKLADHVQKIYVIEDGQNILEKNIKSLGINVIGEQLFPKFPVMTHFTPDVIAKKLLNDGHEHESIADVPFRLPSNCPGCSHLFIYHVLKKHGIKASTDVTCGGLGLFPHVNAFVNAKCMGSSIGLAHGFNVVSKDMQKYVAVIGDGGFWATGINGLINLVYNGGKSTVIIVDNRCIAMTGGQSLPSGNFGYNYKQENVIDIADMCKAVGIKEINVVDPYNVDELEKTILAAVRSEVNSVVIVRKECLVKFKPQKTGTCYIDQLKCKKCKTCLFIGCFAIEQKMSVEATRTEINPDLCVGCGLCKVVCEKGAIDYASS
jgi:indolepyruvate ferredoxin oxidoreductase alpha subunit